MSLIAIIAMSFFYSNQAEAFGRLFPGLFNNNKGAQRSGVAQNRRARANETTGGARLCIDGSCGNDSIRSERPRRLPRSRMSHGVDRALTTIFRSCDVVNPLTNLVTVRNGRVGLSFNNDTRSHYLNSSYSTAVGGIDTVRQIRNGSEVAANGPYARSIANAECPDVTVRGQRVDPEQHPTVFQNGGTLSYVSGEGLNPFSCRNPSSGFCNMHPESESAIGLDCMDMVATFMASGCLKFTKDDNFSRTSGRFLPSNACGESTCFISNRNVANTLDDSNSCFGDVDMNGTKFLQDGDLFFGIENPNHAVVFTDVDPSDPFGIEAILRDKNRDCNSLTPFDFNFSLAQSTSVESLGPSKVAAGDWFCFHNRTDRMNNNLGCNRGGVDLEIPFPLATLFDRASRICHNRESGRRLPDATLDSNYKFVRHSERSECVMDANECPKVIGDECADRCVGDVGNSYVGS